VFLANLYYDIDLRSRFTPYIGVGIGFAYNRTTTGTVADTCGCGFTGVTIASDSKWTAAGALMGGFSFAMRDRLHIDAGYRYLMLGDAHTGLITGTVAGGGGGQSGDPVIKDMWSHEFRVGLRYDIR
jgi:opacity protein-like surface antigen